MFLSFGKGLVLSGGIYNFEPEFTFSSCLIYILNSYNPNSAAKSGVEVVFLPQPSYQYIINVVSYCILKIKLAEICNVKL